MRLFIVALLVAISYAQTGKENGKESRLMKEMFGEDEMTGEQSVQMTGEESVAIEEGDSLHGAQDARELTNDEYAQIYKIVEEEFRKEGMVDAAERTVQEWAELSAQSASERRRRLRRHSKGGGKRSACVAGKAWNLKKCEKKFNEIVNDLMAHEGNVAHPLCEKPPEKRGGSAPSCCGAWQVGPSCIHPWHLPTLPNCCGATQISNGFCYADHGSFYGIDNHDVCPPGKWSCTRWGIVGAATYCADSTGTCAGEVWKSVTALAQLIGNALAMAFTGGASELAKIAVNTGKAALMGAARGVGRTALMTGITTSLRNAGSQFMWKNIGTNIMQHFKDVPEQIGNYLVEEVLAIHSAKDAEDAFAKRGQTIWKMAEIVDPTGLLAFTSFLKEHPDRCKYPRGPMPGAINEMVRQTGLGWGAEEQTEETEETKALQAMETQSAVEVFNMQHAVQFFACVGILSLVYYASQCTKSALLSEQRTYQSIENPEES